MPPISRNRIAFFNRLKNTATLFLLFSLSACAQQASHSGQPEKLKNMSWEKLEGATIDKSKCRIIDRFLSTFDEHLCIRSNLKKTHALKQMKQVFLEAGWSLSESDISDLALRRSPNGTSDGDFFAVSYIGPESCNWHVIVFLEPQLIDFEKAKTPLFSVNKFKKVCD